jgi:hypothetical protein
LGFFASLNAFNLKNLVHQHTCSHG